MKSGTSQKLILNMISSVYMIKVGRVKGNKMVHMQLSNNKLVDRGTRYVSEALNIDYNTAQELIEQWGSVDEAIKEGRKSKKYI
jgi:N-acetylmuramic acid 6-phosphate etherase